MKRQQGVLERNEAGDCIGQAPTPPCLSLCGGVGDPTSIKKFLPFQLKPHPRRTRIPQKGAGFTLLELMLVVTILGILAMVIFPRVSSFGAGNLKRTARHLGGLIQHLAQESVSRKKTFRLYYNLENAAYWSEVLGENREFVPTGDPLAPRRVLPKGISFEDVITSQQGKVNEGEAYTEFYPVGVEKTWIHLKQGDRLWTLVINPLTGRVKVFEKYVE